jgi:radical SAM superfamily enzyme YgiQ (UPF0313 family)
MKILLIQPAKPLKALAGEDFSVFEPLALEYLAAGVAENHDVRILDMRLEGRLTEVPEDFRPDIVGITSFTVHVNIVKGLFRQVRAFDPAILTVVGGHHATIAPEDFCVPDVDVIVRGEGVFVFREIVERREKKLGMEGAEGARRFENDTVVIGRESGAFDLDGLPFPRRDLTARYRGSYFSEWMRPLASIRTSKGCPNRCRFCALWKLTGGRYYTRKPERILEELRTIEEPCVYFCDDESMLDRKRMEALADIIKGSGIRKRYFCYARTDTIARHPELFRKWKDIGLERVFVGFEFYRDRDLKMINKGTDAETNARALAALKELRMDIWPMFMVRPDFDRQDFEDLKDHCYSLGLDIIGFPVLTPLPGTDLMEETKDQLISTNHDFFDFFHTLLPTKLPLDDFYKELANLYRHARPLKNQLRLLKKYPIRQLPSVLRKHNAILNRLKTLDQDYSDQGS